MNKALNEKINKASENLIKVEHKLGSKKCDQIFNKAYEDSLGADLNPYDNSHQC